jgi:hypothetical protein
LNKLIKQANKNAANKLSANFLVIVHHKDMPALSTAARLNNGSESENNEKKSDRGCRGRLGSVLIDGAVVSMFKRE